MKTIKTFMKDMNKQIKPTETWKKPKIYIYLERPDKRENNVDFPRDLPVDRIMEDRNKDR